jgi:hypothetical protein
MFRHNDSILAASRPPSPGQRRSPVPPTNGPILLPNLSSRLPLDEELGSPEFRDALQTAKENRSEDGPTTCRIPSPLPSGTLLPSYPISHSHRTQDLDSDHTKRMQTRIAIHDNLKSPHPFQIIPLDQVKTARAPVKPLSPTLVSRKPSTCREKRSTFVAPASYSAGLAMTVSVTCLNKYLCADLSGAGTPI